jgi:DNA-directed RNA polymerase specialized sigma subunit
MTKYELMEKTEYTGEIWYYIRKDDGFSVENSWTKNLEDAEKMFKELEEGKSSEPVIKILKTIEVDEN